MSSQSNIAGQAGVHAIGKIFSEEFGWIFRDQPVGDFGIDAHVEVCKSGRPTGRLIALQIKYGESYLKHKTKDGFLYRGVDSHLEYWTKHSLPVILVLCDPVQNISYWESISHEKIQRTSKGWRKLPRQGDSINGELLSVCRALLPGVRPSSIKQTITCFLAMFPIETSDGQGATAMITLAIPHAPASLDTFPRTA